MHEDSVKTPLSQQVNMLHVVTAKQISWEAIKINFFSMCQRKQKMTKKIWRKKEKNLPESDGRMTPDYLVATLSKLKSRPFLKLRNFCGGYDTLKVINERCITTSLDAINVHSITLNKS